MLGRSPASWQKVRYINANFMINQEFAYDLEEQDKYREAIPYRLKIEVINMFFSEFYI